MGEGRDKKEINPCYYSPLGNHNKMPAFIYSKYCQCHTRYTIVDTPFPQNILWANLLSSILLCNAKITLLIYEEQILRHFCCTRTNRYHYATDKSFQISKRRSDLCYQSLTRNEESRTVKSTFYRPIFSKFYLVSNHVFFLKKSILAVQVFFPYTLFPYRI